MNLGMNFMLALKGLATSKMRAFLTMLGIIIGVAAVIIIMSLGNGMEVMMTDSFESMGSNTLSVTLMGRGSTRTATVDDMYEIAAENPESILCVSPTVTVSGRVKANGEEYYPTVTGVGEDYLDVKNYKLDYGRMIQYIDISYRKPVCVVGAFYNSETVFDGNAIGSMIKINGIKYTIVGVVEAIGDDPADEDSSTDNFIYIPYSNASKMSWMRNISSFTFVALNDDTVDEAENAINSELTKIYGSDDYYIILNMSELLDSLSEIMDTFVLVLSAIAGISLLVGGIGIMNIMLVSVTERTREIGIRKALGAKQIFIKSQFVIEAATTSAIGGIIGVILGILIADFAGTALDIESAPTLSAIGLAFGISVGIGVVFGFLPANKAAKLNPIDALRNE